MNEPTSMHPTRISADIGERDVVTFRVDEAPDYHDDGGFINVYLQKTRTGEYMLCVSSVGAHLSVIPVSGNTIRVTQGK